MPYPRVRLSYTECSLRGPSAFLRAEGQAEYPEYTPGGKKQRDYESRIR